MTLSMDKYLDPEAVLRAATELRRRAQEYSPRPRV